MAISKDWYNTEFEENETESKHRPPSVEYSFYTAVKTGDMETVIQNCNADSFTNLEGTGVLSRNPVTNLKYHFVVTAAMLTRYCIDGGMEAEQPTGLVTLHFKNGFLHFPATDCRPSPHYGKGFTGK